jgi:hypothetical protein
MMLGGVGRWKNKKMGVMFITMSCWWHQFLRVASWQLAGIGAKASGETCYVYCLMKKLTIPHSDLDGSDMVYLIQNFGVRYIFSYSLFIKREWGSVLCILFKKKLSTPLGLRRG